MSIKVLLADDHKIMRNGLRSLLEKQPGMEVVGEASNGRATIRLVRELSPDVVLMDVSMHDLNGIEATQQITAEAPRVKVIALSMHSDRRFVAGMLSGGAAGYLLKDCDFKEVVHAIRVVAKNGTYLSPGITGIVVKDYARTMSKTESSLSSLTAREREVLQLMAEGKTTKEIASLLFVSVKTIETHRLHIMEKLDTHSVAELTKFAVREGLTSLES